ncbi:MAG: sel1 repeat family protein, partial [Defluviitaleaceae bacterium]|nr:sel1 repeat family protein [Defluviitaleaceae bacterium]
DTDTNAEMVENSTVFLLLSSANTSDSQSVQISISQAMALDMKRLEHDINNCDEQGLYILNRKLHEVIKRKGASYKDSAFVDEGINVANQIGIKALIFLLVAVVGGFIVVRAYDILERLHPSPYEMVENTPHNIPISPPGTGYISEPVLDTATLEIVLDQANEGSIDAMYELGHMFLDSHDFELAAYWFKQAANGEHIGATMALGTLYWDGAGHHDFSDRAEAFMWFYKAAELGHANMQNWVAGFYRTGATIQGAMHDGERDANTLEIPRDYDMAMYWYRRAALQGHSGAQTSLGVMYVMGEGTAVDTTQAVYWYRHAAAQGHAIAQGNLGISYILGEGVDQCYQQAAYWFRQSAELDNSPAQVNLAWMYENGHIGPPDLELSFYWNHRAAALGNTIAQNNIGLMYMQGRGVKQCYDQAIYWFRRTAANNCERGIAYLALAYEARYQEQEQ